MLVRRLLRGLGLVATGTAALLLLAWAFISTDAGRGSIARLIGTLRTESGFGIRVGHLDGALLGAFTAHDVRLIDTAGTWARVPELTVDWRPLAFAGNRLDIRRARAPLMTVLRRPAFAPTRTTRLLPEFDLLIEDVRIDRIHLDPPVMGRPGEASLAGRAIAHAGRLDLVIDGRAVGDADRVDLHALIEPDRDLLDLKATLDAPRAGLLVRLLRLPDAMSLSVAGKGRFSRWHGTAVAHLGGRPLLQTGIGLARGHGAIRGRSAIAPLLPARWRPAAGTVQTIALQWQPDPRGARFRLGLVAGTARLGAAGILDPGSETLHDTHVIANAPDARVVQPLMPSLDARDLRLRARLSGPLAAPTLQPTLRAGMLREDGYALTNAVLTFAPVDLSQPVRTIGIDARADRLTTGLGQLDTALQSLHASATVGLGDTLDVTIARLASDRLAGKGRVRYTASSGALDAAIDLRASRFALPRQSVADVETRLHVARVHRGAAFALSGPLRLTRIASRDPGLAPWINGGTVVAHFTRIGETSTRVDQILISSGRLAVSGGGQLTGDALSGRIAGHLRAPFGPPLALPLRSPGPLAFTADIGGTLAAPRLTLEGRLDRLETPWMTLTGLRAHAHPAGEAYAVTVEAASAAGPLNARMTLLPDSQRPALRDLAVALGPLTLNGHLQRGTRGLWTGRIDTALAQTPRTNQALPVSGTLDGHVILSEQAGQQAFTVDASARHLSLLLDKESILISRLALTGSARADRPLQSLRLDLSASGIRFGGWWLDVANAQAVPDGAMTSLRLAAVGNRGTPFALSLETRAGTDRVETTLGGRIAEDAIASRAPLVAERTRDGWLLQPGVISFGANGSLALDGRLRLPDWSLGLRLTGVPVELVELVKPGLGVTGRLSGRAALQGQRLHLTGLDSALTASNIRRANLTVVTQPVQLRTRARLAGRTFSLVASASMKGKSVGSAELALGPWAEQAVSRLDAPLRARVDWSGPGDVLWGLAGLEDHALSGPIRVAMTASGRGDQPVLAGTIHTDSARYENLTLGLTADPVRIDAHLEGNRLIIDSFDGRIGNDGSIDGAGFLDLSAAKGFPAEISLNLTRARILRRDDANIMVSGPITFSYGADGGRATGVLDIDRARLRIGGASTEPIPVMDVTEINIDPARGPTRRKTVNTLKPIDLDITARGRSDIMLDGMGLNSEWRGTLRVTGTAAVPLVVGRMNLVKGTYEFAGREFNLDRGSVSFTGERELNPVLDIQASHAMQGATARIGISGSARRPAIAFSSNPSLPQDEVLSRLLFGESIASLSPLEAVQLASAVAGMAQTGGGLDVVNRLRRTAGIDRLRVAPADKAKGVGTVISGGKYLTDRVYLEVSTDGQGYTSTLIEVELTRALSVLSQIATLGGTNVGLKWSKDY